MGNKELSKTERYNNPGAIRPGKIIYEGQVDVDADGFAIFETPEAGRRALINQINTQIKRGENTVDTFLNRYAPPGKENPPASRDNYRVFLAEQLGLSSTSDPFPEGSTERIADAITKFEGGTWGKPPAAPPEASAETEEAGKPAPTLKDKFGQLFDDAKKLAVQTAEENPTEVRAGLDVAGALIGRKAGQSLEAGQTRFERNARQYDIQQRAAARAAERAAAERAAQLAQNVEVLPATQTPLRPGAVPVPQPPGGAVTAPPSAPVGPADAGRMAPGQTGQMVYNYGKAAGLTDIEAARALDMTKQTGGVHDLSTIRREGTQRVQSLFPGERYVENPRFGGLLTPDQGAGGGPRASYVMERPTPPPIQNAPPLSAPPQQQSTLRALPVPEPIPNAPIETPAPSQPRPSPLLEAAKSASRGLSRTINVGARAYPGAAGLLSGLGAAELGQQAYSRFSEGDVPGGILASVGAGSSALSLFPFPVTRVPSTLLAVMSPLVLYGYDKMKEHAISQAKGYGALAGGATLPTPTRYSGYTAP